MKLPWLILLFAGVTALCPGGMGVCAAAAETVTAVSDTPVACGTLRVRVAGLRSGHGNVKISLFAGPAGFPAQPEQAFRQAVADIQGNSAQAEFGPVPAGDYALSVYHDENQNNRLDLRWPGIPLEGTGASRDAQGKYGPPAYGDARFHYAGNAAEQEIKIHYLF